MAIITSLSIQIESPIIRIWTAQDTFEGAGGTPSRLPASRRPQTKLVGLPTPLGGAGSRAANSGSMSATATHVEQLERVLLRRGVGALEADRHCCEDCGRTPLTGEHVHVYGGPRERIVCALCRPGRREVPLATELVRHCEHGYTVRLTGRAA